MNELIDRQEAIDAVHKAIFDFFDICSDDDESPITYKDEQLLEINKAITTRIRELSSAEPEIIRCKDCKWWKSSWKYCHYIHFDTNKKFYCAFGERRPDATFK